MRTALPEDASPAAQSPGYVTDSGSVRIRGDSSDDDTDDDDGRGLSRRGGCDEVEEYLARPTLQFYLLLTLFSVGIRKAFVNDETAPTPSHSDQGSFLPRHVSLARKDCSDLSRRCQHYMEACIDIGEELAVGAAKTTKSTPGLGHFGMRLFEAYDGDSNGPPWTGVSTREVTELDTMLGVAAALANVMHSRSRIYEFQRGGDKKLESEYWNLKVRGTDLMTYNQRFQELALMCDRMFPEESAKVERYVGGLPDMIHGSVKASKPQSMQEAIEFATEMMDKKMLTAAERQAENKRKFEDTSRNNQNQQQPFKRNNVARAYTAGPGDKKPYGGTKPLCAKCNYHHDGPCTQKCTNCKKLGHSARDCKVRPTANNNNNNNQRTQGTNPRVITCFECGVQGHYKSDCPKLKNGNQGNRAGNGNAVARAYVVGSAGTNPNSNVVTGTFLLNNRYASILFDTGADRSFISTAFSSLIDIIPTTLDHGYDVELADGRIIWVNTLIRGCTLNFLNHPFNIDLMPVEMGSFDVIIGMDWLAKYHAVIVCDEKLVRVPFGDKTLIFHGDGSDNGHESRLNIISCTKTQKYLLEGCPIFLAQVTMKKAEDESKKKQLEEVPIVQDFLEVFPEDLPGIPPTRQVEFQIDLIPGARAPCSTGTLIEWLPT
ncbi:putative reverse transcriptase domain-containing protein [Tanacetum coccineum]